MEKRHAYIITAITIVTLFTGLAAWYVYLAQKEASVGALSELDYYGGTPGSQTRPLTADAPEGGFGVAPTPPNGAIPATDTSASTTSDTATTTGETWVLQQIHSNPIAGAQLETVGTSTEVRLVERKTGSMLIAPLHSGDKTRVGGVTLTGIQKSVPIGTDRVLFIKEGTPAHILRVGSGSVVYTFPEEVLDAVYDGFAKVYYMSTNPEGGVVVRTFNPSSGATDTLWQSPLRGWDITLVGDTALLVSQKPSRGVSGHAYLLNTTTKTLAPIVSDTPGLMSAVSPRGDVVFSQSDSSGTRLFLRVQGGEVTELSIATLATKCLWSSDGENFYCAVPNKLPKTLPDSWLKGQISFSDTLWRINTKTGEARALTEDTGLDIVELQEGEGVVLFKNKTDQTLWSVIQQ